MEIPIKNMEKTMKYKKEEQKNSRGRPPAEFRDSIFHQLPAMQTGTVPTGMTVRSDAQAERGMRRTEEG